jgi:hypothetical protein
VARQPPEIRPRFDRFSPDRFWDAIGAAALEAIEPAVAGELRVSKMCESLGAFKSHLGSSRAIALEEIELTPPQCDELQRRIREDFAADPSRE